MDNLGKQMAEMLQILTNNMTQPIVSLPNNTKTNTTTQSQETETINEKQKLTKIAQPVTPWNVAQRRPKAQSISPPQTKPPANTKSNPIVIKNTFAALADPPNQQ
jgi:hypothetical protein